MIISIKAAMFLEMKANKEDFWLSDWDTVSVKEERHMDFVYKYK